MPDQPADAGNDVRPCGDRSRFVASTIIEMSDLQAFVADPARGVDVVGGIDSPEWGYRPFVSGSATVTAGDAGRLVQLEATIRIDDEDVRIVMSTTLPKGSGSRSRWRAIRTWSVTVFGANGGGSGTAAADPHSMRSASSTCSSRQVLTRCPIASAPCG